METLLLLATEASHGGGFGLNLDILDTNLINLAILIGVLLYFGPSVLGKILTERRTSIEEEITEAEKRLQDAAAALAEQQEKLTRAQTEAEQIKANAEERAKALKESMMAQAAKDVEKMKAAASQQLDSERDRVIAELGSIVSAKALESVESQLKERLDDGAQHQLIDRSLGLLGG
jgi:F-type H+-transporting ATPase subunit b